MPYATAAALNPTMPRLVKDLEFYKLEKLPNVGAKLAQRIIEHREKYGKFRKPEHLILVQGISDNRFRGMRNLIKTE